MKNIISTLIERLKKLNSKAIFSEFPQTGSRGGAIFVQDGITVEENLSVQLATDFFEV